MVVAEYGLGCRRNACDQATQFQTKASHRHCPIVESAELRYHDGANKITTARFAIVRALNGTAHHQIGEQFNDMAGTKLLHIPYKGSAPALTDLMGGQIQVMFDTASSCLPYITSGKVRVLAVTSAKRSVALPDVPTLSESGLTGFNVATWFGLMAPAGTPRQIVTQLQKETARMLAIPEMREQLLKAGAEPVGSTSEQMAQQIHGEVQRFTALAKKVNLELE